MAFALCLQHAQLFAAPVLTGSAEIEVAGGHDDNLFLSASPDGLGSLTRAGGGFVSIAPALAGDLAAAGFRLRLAYFAEVRAASAVGRLETQLLDLRGWLPAWRALRVHLAVFAGAFDATRSAADQYHFAGGELGFHLGLGESAMATLRARTELRALTPVTVGPRDRDWLLSPTLRVPWQLASWLEVAPGLGAVFVSPLGAGTTSDFRRLRGGLDTTAVAGIWTVMAEGWGGQITVSDRSETHAGGRLEARIDVGTGIQVFASAELAAPVSSGASDYYARRSFLLGITARGAARPTKRKPVSPGRDLRPRVKGEFVRLRIEAPGATAVTLVGSWNDWATPGEPLTAAAEPGLWELTLKLPSGSHRYHFVVDGQPRRPPEAPRYVSDGFGSDDGVIDVTATSDL